MSVEIQVDNYNGGPLMTNTLLRGHVRVTLPKPEHLHSLTRLTLTFSGRSTVHITRHRLATYTKYSSHHRFERAEGTPGYLQSENRGERSEWRTSTYGSQCLLFAQRHVLAPADFRMPAPGDDCVLDFPFEIRIPTHASPQPPDSIHEHGCEPFAKSGYFPGSLGYGPPKDQGPQPLPDSLPRFVDSVDENAEGVASVRYTLHAIVPELAGSGRWMSARSAPPEGTVDIPLCNPLSLPPSPTQYKALGHQHTIRTMRLLRDHQEKKSSFRDSMRGIFQHDRLPWLALGIVLRVPERLWLDQPPETRLSGFSLGVRRLAAGIGEKLPHINSSEVATPRVFLESLKLKLVAHTALRGGYDRFSGYGPKRFEGLTAVTLFKFKGSSSTPRLELSVGEDAWTDLGQALSASLGDLRAAAAKDGVGGITGEFLTPNVWRRWGFEWDLTLECGGEEIRWLSETHSGGGLGVRFLRGNGQWQ